MYPLFTWLVLIFSTVLLLVYWRLKKFYEHLRACKIPSFKPYIAIFGLKESFRLKKLFAIELARLHHYLEPHSLYGLYDLFRCTIIIRDPELVKRVLVKDFAHFQNHGTPVPRDVEPLLRHLFSMEGEEWKNLRMKMTGIFTSGKMKMMFPLVKKCAESMKPVLMQHVTSPEGLEMKDVCSRYTTDVIGNCVFGLDMNSLENPHTEFCTMGNRIFEFRWRSMLRFLLPELPNWCVEYFGLEMFSRDVMDYFMKLIKDMVKYREKNDITRGDFLDLLIAMKNHTQSKKFAKDGSEDADLAKFMAQVGEKCIKTDVEMTVELMAANCFLFFIAGFEVSSIAAALLLFHLAQQPEIQDKVRNEVVSAIDSNGGEITYDMLKNLPYLNMVLQETLRMHTPNGGTIIRKCNEDYKIPESGSIITKGTSVLISLTGLHSDKKYWQYPDQFYPEHFTKEAISKKPHYTYMPFGEGPRVCIAGRFANMQIMTAVAYLIKDFSFQVSPRTIVPLEFLPSLGAAPVKGGVWLTCKPVSEELRKKRNFELV